MPAKYVIHTRPVQHRFEPITKSGIIAWEEGCLKCPVCVKKSCIYSVYEKRGLDPRQMIESIDNQCMNCFRCIQSCPKQLIHKSINPEFKSIGDTYWTPDIIARLWYQAETGKIPVSGAGYPGPFSGPGFDSMWTDMSEIVRPTRDGIHGREYISTAVDLGKKPPHLNFNNEGGLEGETPSIVDIPLPIMMKLPPFGSIGEMTLRGWAMAARRLSTLLALPADMITPELDNFAPWLIPLGLGGRGDIPSSEVRIVEIPGEQWSQRALKENKRRYPNALISVQIPMERGSSERARELVNRGVSIIHLSGSLSGGFVDHGELTLKDGLRSVHCKLLKANVRDKITLLASGGLAMAEHVAKALICGADAVYVDLPILIALECRMCRRCTKGLSCPVEVQKASSGWTAARSVNLLGAWHNQLLEVMGAMGIRDARRLRGEAGRAMFFEDLDRGTFESLGTQEEGYELE